MKGGSTVVGWTNDSLPYSPCPIEDLKRLKETVFDDDNKIKNSVIQPMAENLFILDKVARIEETGYRRQSRGESESESESESTT